MASITYMFVIPTILGMVPLAPTQLAHLRALANRGMTMVLILEGFICLLDPHAGSLYLPVNSTGKRKAASCTLLLTLSRGGIRAHHEV
jgi:phosphatidylglycerophosphate synthase